MQYALQTGPPQREQMHILQGYHRARVRLLIEQGHVPEDLLLAQRIASMCPSLN